MAYRQTTAPIEEPVTLAEAKTALRVDHSFEDALVSALIVAARQQVEVETERQLVTASWQLTRDRWPTGRTIAINLPRLQSVTSITYVDTAGATQTLSSDNYHVDTASEPGRIVLASNKSWPSINRRPNAIVVSFSAGYGAAAAVPETAKHAIKLLVGAWYLNREATSERKQHALDFSYRALISQLQWRCHTLTEDAEDSGGWAFGDSVSSSSSTSDLSLLTSTNKSGGKIWAGMALTGHATEDGYTLSDNNAAGLPVRGFAKADSEDDASLIVQTDGVLTLTDWSRVLESGSSTLTRNADYFASNTPGKITATEPTAGDLNMQRIGNAASSTQLAIRIEQQRSID